MAVLLICSVWPLERVIMSGTSIIAPIFVPLSDLYWTVIYVFKCHFFSNFKWQWPDGRPLAEAIADMLSKWRQQPDITTLAWIKQTGPCIYIWILVTNGVFFSAKFNWQRPDGGPLARVIADMPSKCRKRPNITMLAGKLQDRQNNIAKKYTNKEDPQKKYRFGGWYCETSLSPLVFLLLTVPRRCFLCWSFCVCLCFLWCLFIAALWLPVELTSWLSSVWDFLVFCHFPIWCYTWLYRRLIFVFSLKASSHIDENDPASSCAYWRIGLKHNSLPFVNVRFKSLVMFAWMRLHSFVIAQLALFVGKF